MNCLLPVLDIKNGVVVQGMAGHRDQYRPIQSKITASCEPLEVARAVHQQLGCSRFYVADLDSLGGGAIQMDILLSLCEPGYELWVDANWWDENTRSNVELPLIQRIFSSEGILDWALADKVLASLSPFVFSADIADDKLLGAFGYENDLEMQVMSLVDHLQSLSLQDLIVLDVRSVGTDSGPRRTELLKRVSAKYPDLGLISGGGVRNQSDVDRFLDAGCQQVLVASAIHDNRFGTSKEKR